MDILKQDTGVLSDMGELIRQLGEIEVCNTLYKIELNGPGVLNGPHMIHVQNPSFRFECSEKDFLKICSAVFFAKKNLDSYKD